MSTLLYQTSTLQDGNLSFMHGVEKDVLRNRLRFLSTHAVDYKDCVVMEVEHADRITHVSTKDKGSIHTSEAFITNEKELVLFLLTGDCFPICYFDPMQEVVGLAHLGWRPTTLQLAQQVVVELQRVYGSKPENIQVYIGPGIHKESYLFRDPVQRRFEGWSTYLTELPDGKTQIDLLGHIRAQLTDSGVLAQNITIHESDTASSKDYFSYYRSKITGEQDGRFVTIVGLRG